MTKLTYVIQPEKNKLDANKELYQADSEVLKKNRLRGIRSD